MKQIKRELLQGYDTGHMEDEEIACKKAISSILDETEHQSFFLTELRDFLLDYIKDELPTEPWERAIQKEYLYQQGLVYNKCNQDLYGLQGELKLMDETDDYYIIKHTGIDIGNPEYLNVVWKGERPMDTIEL
jgi:hypothetical protein